MATLMAVLFAVFFGVALYLYFRKNSDFNEIRERFKDVVDIEDETKKAEKTHSTAMAQNEKELKTIQSTIETTRSLYKEKRVVFDKLLTEIKLMDETVDLMSYGVYEPHFDFDTSERYKLKLTDVRQLQKQMVKIKTAATCRIEWTVDGSKAKGRKQTNHNIRLILRAFNSECDAAVLKAKWNNVNTMQQRINRAFEAINKLGETQHISISREYLQLKLKELFCAYEYADKKHEEQEEQRRIREEMREEEKALREIEKAQADALKEETRYHDALEKAKEEVGEVEGAKQEKLNQKIALLEAKLVEAQQNKERALSRAQLTKSGHVYVISNVGSFGENVYKIGMTRRLEPIDRVKELGDASVPFKFDVHAMIFSENAPELETKLHHKFDDKRMNRVNNRKEFFKIGLQEIEDFVHTQRAEIEFTKLAEAREFRETLAILEQQLASSVKQEKGKDEFPDEI